MAYNYHHISDEGNVHFSQSRRDAILFCNTKCSIWGSVFEQPFILKQFHVNKGICIPVPRNTHYPSPDSWCTFLHVIPPLLNEPASDPNEKVNMTMFLTYFTSLSICLLFCQLRMSWFLYKLLSDPTLGTGSLTPQRRPCRP